MLSLRVEGDRAEALALLEVLAAAGVEVQTGTIKARREGFHHVYAVARLADHQYPPRSGDVIHGDITRTDPAAAPGRRAITGRRR